MITLQGSMNCSKVILNAQHTQNIYTLYLLQFVKRGLQTNQENGSYYNECKNCQVNNKIAFSTQRRQLSIFSQAFNYYRDGPGNRTLWEPDVKGRYKQKDPKMWDSIKLGFPEIKGEILKWHKEMKEKFDADPIYVRPGDTDVVFEFNNQENIDRFLITSDSDHKEGYSHGSLTISPTGHGLFSGYIDLAFPKDGEVKKAGYVNMTSLPLRKSFKRQTCFNWMMYTHMVMRVRGDGRRYLLALNTAGTFDITWHDLYIYVLYTRGGPYWQDVKIPFSKFCLSSKGRVQDKQFAINLQRVNKVGITAADRAKAPFRLEIDYIGVHFDPAHTEEFAYEQYRIPKFLV